MKLVSPLALLCSPETVLQIDNSPLASDGKANILADGSVICITDNKIYDPEAIDGELWAMRQRFDRDNGINASDRIVLPAILKAAA